MARISKVPGFSVENIVNVDRISLSPEERKEQKKANAAAKAEKEAQIKADNQGQRKRKSKAQIIDRMMTDDKERVMVYLDKDVKILADFYGERLGKKNGGRSTLINEALKTFMKNNNLWEESIIEAKLMEEKED